MATTINRAAFVQLIEEDIAWLEKQPRSLERDHIEAVLRDAPSIYYPETLRCPQSKPKPQASS
jgi:hypothetical protein